MKLRPQDIAKLEQFLDKLAADTYPEPDTPFHSGLTERMLSAFLDKHPLPDEARVLDVGCGQGVALRLFSAKGYKPTGITLNDDDLNVCRENGFDVQRMDQSFLDFDDQSFDLVWCRHCLEHSAIPYLTLHELFRVLREGGYAYIEVPAPDTASKHQSNRNHYSVLGQAAWLDLIGRVGFAVESVQQIDFTTGLGPDAYWAFVQSRPAAAS